MKSRIEVQKKINELEKNVIEIKEKIKEDNSFFTLEKQIKQMAELENQISSLKWVLSNQRNKTKN